MPLFEYSIYTSDGHYIGDHEELFRSHKDALDEMEFAGDDGEVLIGKKKLPIFARTLGHWESAPRWDSSVGAIVKNSKDRDRIAASKGLVAWDDASGGNKYFSQDLMEKKAAANAHWDKRHQEFFDIKEREMRNGRSEEQAELHASIEWGSESKLKEDQKFYNKGVAERKLPTNLVRKT